MGSRWWLLALVVAGGTVLPACSSAKGKARTTEVELEWPDAGEAIMRMPANGERRPVQKPKKSDGDQPDGIPMGMPTGGE